MVKGFRLEEEHSRTALAGASAVVKGVEADDGAGTVTACGEVALLTGGGDKHYAVGLARGLLGAGRRLEFVGSDDLDVDELRGHPGLRFHNLRGNQDPGAGMASKIVRILRYYGKLIGFVATNRARVFHILWNNKFELFDRTLLMLYYRLLGKRVVMTIHNVNKEERDGCDHALNRWSLRAQYNLCDHLFAHTAKMKQELEEVYGVSPSRISLIPYGINDAVPETDMDRGEARRLLGIGDGERVVLFFGNIAPYKGLEHLVEAMALLPEAVRDYRLVIAGRPKGSEEYWARIQERIRSVGLEQISIERIEYVPDEDTEIYFKAADVLVLPYVQIFQSGVLFLGYRFGLPAIASDVGSLREYIREGESGMVCAPADPAELARALRAYFGGDLYQRLDVQREAIRRFAEESYSWRRVSEITEEIYGEVLGQRKGAGR